MTESSEVKLSLRNVRKVFYPGTVNEKVALNDISLDLEDETEDTEELELFRFFPDGGASGMRELTFSIKELKRRYRISPLTGQLFLVEEDEN